MRHLEEIIRINSEEGVGDKLAPRAFKGAVNVNKVPAKQWRRWNEPARQVFNRLFGAMTVAPDLFQHPSTEVADELWETTAWNAAWSAANETRDLTSPAR